MSSTCSCPHLYSFRDDIIWLLTLHLPSLADLGRETGLDGRDTASRTAVVASDEVQAVLALVELGIGGLAGLASNVLDCKIWLVLCSGAAKTSRPITVPNQT